MRMLKIEKKVVESLIAHAQKDYPIEACGYLAQRDGVVVSAFPLTNTDASVDHFTLDPQEQFSAVKKMRSLGLTLKGVYHSHPVTPARPSQEDIRLAYDPDLSYVIISLADGSEVVKSFRIVKGSVQEEPVTVLTSAEEI